MTILRAAQVHSGTSRWKERRNSGRRDVLEVAELAFVRRKRVPDAGYYSENRPAQRPYITPKTGITVVILLVIIFWRQILGYPNRVP